MPTIAATPDDIAELLKAKTTAENELRKMRRINSAFKAGRREFSRRGFSPADFRKFKNTIEHNPEYGPVPFPPLLIHAKKAQIERLNKAITAGKRLLASPEAVYSDDRLEAAAFASQWPDILKCLLAEFDGEHTPFIEDEYRYYFDLKTLRDTEGISRLFLRHNPRAYWSSDTGTFRIQCFLSDVTDGRIPIDDVIAACPNTAPLTYSAALAAPA